MDTTYEELKETKQKWNEVYRMTIELVAALLSMQAVPYESVRTVDGGYQLRFPWCEGDIICGSNSVMNRYGRVESYNFPWDRDEYGRTVTALTVEKAVYAIRYYYWFCIGRSTKEQFDVDLKMVFKYS